MSYMGDYILDYQESHFEELATEFVDEVVESDPELQELWYKFVEDRAMDYGQMKADEAQDRRDYDQGEFVDSDNK